MDPDKLKALLKRAHGELVEQGGEEVDPELRSLLGDLDRDIHALLAGPGEAGGAGGASEEEEEKEVTLSGRAEDAAAKFAARHPRAEGVFLEIAEVLGRMGI